MNILVNGIGNIGTTLLTLLNHFQKELRINHIYALKNSPKQWNIEDLNYLESLGISICTRFKDDGYLFLDELIDKVDYIFDCTFQGGGIKNKEWYIDLPNLKGASAQGSEKKFGKPFMTGINDNIITNQKYVQIVSCYTHSLASLLTTFTGNDLANLKNADFVIVKKSGDNANHSQLVTSNMVSKHLDESLGTDNSIEIQHLFETIGKLVQITSSDTTTPTQHMHGVRFNIQFKHPLKKKKIYELIESNSMVSISNKFDSNVIFERGRRIGFQGRIFSHVIVIKNNLLITKDSIKGWGFIPQEGNTLLTTIHAFLKQMNYSDTPELMQLLKAELIYKQW